MARIYNIRWKPEEKREYNRLRKNYNAKIKRLEKSRPDLKGMLPEKISIDQITSRQDFERIVKRTQDFTARGSEEIVSYKGQKIPKYEKLEVQRMIRSINAKKAHDRKMLSYEGGNMRLLESVDLTPYNIHKKRTPEEWEKLKLSLESEYLDTQRKKKYSKYRTMYEKTLDDTLGPLGDPIKELIKNLSDEEIAERSREDAVLSPWFAYDPLESVIKGEMIYNTWWDMMEDTTGPSYTETLEKNIVNWS